MRTHVVGAELFHVDGQTDGQRGRHDEAFCERALEMIFLSELGVCVTDCSQPKCIKPKMK